MSGRVCEKHQEYAPNGFCRWCEPICVFKAPPGMPPLPPYAPPTLKPIDIPIILTAAPPAKGLNSILPDTGFLPPFLSDFDPGSSRYELPLFMGLRLNAEWSRSVSYDAYEVRVSHGSGTSLVYATALVYVKDVPEAGNGAVRARLSTVVERCAFIVASRVRDRA